MGKLRIELKSDLCVSNGESYNTMLDGDVCYDTYGLPYIPAKRIKGCLREAAEELRHMGDCLKDDKFRIDVEQIFGAEDRGVLILSNARLIEKDADKHTLHYEDFVSDLLYAKNEDGQEFHQQQVISMFTYIRKMTKLNEYGSAEDTSLRSLRVLKRGLLFEADIDIDKNILEAETALSFDTVKTELELCCKALRHMGIHRTRGMGEISVSVHELEEKPKNHSDFSKTEQTDADAVGQMDYKFELCAPVVIKNIEKGISKTQDYLEGSKIIGILAERIPQETLLEILNDRYTVFSNAYISDSSWNRYTPVPASFRKYKDADEKKLIDHASVTDQNREQIDGQLSALDKFYIFRKDKQAYDYFRKDVETEIRYHHARSANKGIGSIGDDGAFYQVGSICEGQSFQGFIFARKKYLKIMEQAFRQESACRIGSMKNAEYGSAHLYIQTDKEKADKEQADSNWHPLTLRIRTKTKANTQNNDSGVKERFAVKLNAPIIMYNKNGMYSTDQSDFTQLIKDLLLDNSIELKSYFKKYAMIGGFNTTWKMPKPVLSVLDKGSIFIFETDHLCNAIAENTISFAGERITEGYGELEFYKLLDDFNGTLTEQKDGDNYSSGEYQTSIIPALAKMTLKNHCRSTGQRLADTYFGSQEINPKASAILSVTNQFLHSMREYESYSVRKYKSQKKEIKDIIKRLEQDAGDYKKEEKKTIAEEILKLINDSVKEADDSSIQWAVGQYKSDGKAEYNSTAEKFLKKECLKFMLEQLKYKCTEQIKKERKGDGSDGI